MARQGDGMGTAWEQRGMRELAFTVVVNGTHDGIWNDETGHDGKPDFSQHVSIRIRISLILINTYTTGMAPLKKK
jgi:hypothetical protein